jgi:hypothetical protein
VGDGIGLVGLSGFPSLTLRLMAKGTRENGEEREQDSSRRRCSRVVLEREREREFLRFVFPGTCPEAARVGLGKSNPNHYRGLELCPSRP